MKEYTKGMNEYVVSLTDLVDVDSTDLESHYFTFECWAEDIEHAEEQAFNAYPGSIIIDVEKI